VKGLPDQAELQDLSPQHDYIAIPDDLIGSPDSDLRPPTVAVSLAARSTATLEVVLMQPQPVIKKSA
jgi:hypothetical protein